MEPVTTAATVTNSWFTKIRPAPLYEVAAGGLADLAVVGVFRHTSPLVTLDQGLSHLDVPTQWLTDTMTWLTQHAHLMDTTGWTLLLLGLIFSGGTRSLLRRAPFTAAVGGSLLLAEGGITPGILMWLLIGRVILEAVLCGIDVKFGRKPYGEDEDPSWGFAAISLGVVPLAIPIRLLQALFGSSAPRRELPRSPNIASPRTPKQLPAE